MTPMSFLLLFLMQVFVKCLVSLCFHYPKLAYHMLYDWELEYNIMIFVIYVIRYVSLYLLQKWLEIFSS